MRDLLFALLLLPLMASCVKDTAQVTLDSLLDEMISVEESARYPLVPYRCLQVSSYDRSSVSPDSSGWFANNDGYGIVRTDTVDGRVERVMSLLRPFGLTSRVCLAFLMANGVVEPSFFASAESRGTLWSSSLTGWRTVLVRLPFMLRSIESSLFS